MKHRFFFIGLLLAGSACTPQLAYQVLETHAATPGATDQTLALDYNFWNADGVVYCTVKNLTESSIYLDLNRSHLIVNGFVQDYYTDEEQTTSVVRSRTSYSPLLAAYGSSSSQSASSRRTKEKAVRHLPPHSSLVIGGVSAAPHRLLACDLDKWRMKNACYGFLHRRIVAAQVPAVSHVLPPR